MREGKLLQIGPPEEIYNRPVDLFVASFTGATNRLSGRVLDRQGEFGTIEAASGHRLTAWLPVGLDAGAAVNIVVRPENVQCGTHGSGANQFTARVLAQRYEGAQTVYDLAVLGGQLAVLELGTRARHPVDSDVSITMPPALCWAYPAE
jgi:iron(III) transport system ATP-binding protein